MASSVAQGRGRLTRWQHQPAELLNVESPSTIDGGAIATASQWCDLTYYFAAFVFAFGRFAFLLLWTQTLRDGS
jgi:hypothetical protein